MEDTKEGKKHENNNSTQFFFFFLLFSPFSYSRVMSE